MQGQIIAGAIAASATVETDSSITIDPDKLLNLQPGQSYGPSEDALYGIDFPINPERVAPMLRRLVSPTKTRARIYDRDGVLLVDSRNLFGRGDMLRFDLPPPTAEKPGLFERAFIAVRRWLGRGDLPLYRELGAENGKGYSEVAQALSGQDASMVRINDRGDVIVSVAVPVQRFRAVRGALMLSTQGADIDDMVEAERLAILKVFLDRRRPSWWCCRSCSPARSPSRCAGSPTPPKACAAASVRASKFPISRAATTRSDTSRARCAT